jgi:biotin carboxyl carrier protein
MKYYVSMGDREMEVELGPDGTSVDGMPLSADLMEMDGTDVYSLLLGRESYRILATRIDADDWSVHLAGRHIRAQVVDERTRAIREMVGTDEGPKGPKALRAPMPGMVVKIETEEGDEVEAGQGLVIVEAMKMENELKSEGAGRVSQIHVQAGQIVEKDQILVEFETPPSQPEKGTEE